ncbi:MAG: ABC transporter ATP-binding protein [Phycisphaeraceae bacterium]|nr:ABC transporter ATP-binding protein [Phycisphaeraceae bacterium]
MTSTTADPDLRHDAAPASGDLVVQCARLTKIFRDFWLRHRVRAVDGVDLAIPRGQVFGLLGPNGSGKSTTIKMILALLRPTSGRIAVFGKRPDDVATKKLIGYLPEESYLYRFLNARETLDYYGRLFHLDRRQRQKRIDMLLNMVGLEAVQRRPVGEYSKGMQRRIGLAQALINDPQFLILDEPTTGLDPIGTRQIKDLILELARRGKTVLLCSHLLADVEDVCDRLAIMFGGRIRLEGTVDELLVRQDQTILQTRQLDAATIAEIEKVLQRRGQAIEKIDRPRQRLESLFLEIVHRAQEEGLQTSGATSGGELAAFLRVQDNDPSQPPAAAVLAQLLKPQPPQPPAVEPTPAATPPPKTEDQSLIRHLADTAPAPTGKNKPRAPANDIDRSVIDQLLKPPPPEDPNS